MRLVSSNRECFAHYKHISYFFKKYSLSLYVYTRGVLGCLLGFWPLCQNPAGVAGRYGKISNLGSLSLGQYSEISVWDFPVTTSLSVIKNLAIWITRRRRAERKDQVLNYRRESKIWGRVVSPWLDQLDWTKWKKKPMLSAWNKSIYQNWYISGGKAHSLQNASLV